MRTAIILAALCLSLASTPAQATNVWGEAMRVSGSGCFVPDPATSVTIRRTSTQAVVALTSTGTVIMDTFGNYYWQNCTDDHYDTIEVHGDASVVTITNRWEKGVCP